MNRAPAWKVIGLAWLTVGILDLASAVVVAETQGRGTVRMLQGIASGLLGPASFEGGRATAGLGGAIHFFVALVVTAIFYLASRRLAFLTRHAVSAGLLYGLGVYLVMYWLVIAFVFPQARPSLNRDVTAIVVHMLLIGLPTALIVRRYAQPPSAQMS